jgi:transposase-like protein
MLKNDVDKLANTNNNETVDKKISSLHQLDMPVCKKCQSLNIVKNNTAREKQRLRCKDCKLNFVEGD